MGSVEEYTITPTMGDFAGANELPKYLVSGSRFVKVCTNEAEKLVKVRLYDLSHWSRQEPEVVLEWRWGSGKKARFHLIEGALELPQSVWNVCHAAMLQDSLVFFSVGSSTLSLGSSLVDIWIRICH